MTDLLMALGAFFCFAGWMIALLRGNYWRDRARYAERLEQARYVNLQQELALRRLGGK